MLLRVGDEPIPGYQLERFLGKGQFGQVWQASSPGKASVALKFLDLSEKQGRKEFRAIQRVKLIRHAHLMPIIALWLLDDEGKVLTDAALDGIGEESTVADTLVLDVRNTEWEKPSMLVVAQLLGDKTLGDRLQECLDAGMSGIPVLELLQYLGEAARGIDFLNTAQHDLGDGPRSIQHCDIKPANILLMGNSALVTDYGLARVMAQFGRDARATGMTGSPAYMAPECIAMKPSSASDQYSLAVSYVELRTGKLPFHSESFAEVLESHRQGRLDLSGLPAAERKVIERATSVDPRKRFDTATQMADALRRAVVGDASAGSQRTWRRLALLGAGAATILGAALVIRGFLFPPAQAKTFRIQVTPADAELTLDGELQSLSPDGQYTVDRSPTADLRIAASHPPDYENYEEVRALGAITGEESIQIELPKRASYFEAQALAAYAQGDTTSAIQQFAIALESDKLGTYRRVPEVTDRRTYDDGNLNASRMTTDGRRLITVGGKGVIRLWNLTSDPPGSATMTLGTINTAQSNLRVSTSNNWAAVSDSGRLLLFKLLENMTSETVLSVDVPPGDIMTAISRDEHWLVTATSQIDLDSLPGASDGARVEIHRWDLTATDIVSTKTLIGTHAGQLGEISVTANSESIVHGSWDGSITFWSLQSADPQPQLLAAYSGDVLALTAAGDYLAFGGSVDADLVEDENAAEQCYAMISRNLGPPQRLPFGHRAPVDFMKFDTPGHWLLTAAEESAIQLWDMQSSPISTPRLVGSAHVSPVQDAWFADGARAIVTCKLNGAIEFWDMESTRNPGPLVFAERLPSATSITVTPDGKWLVCCGSEGVWIWNYARCWLLKKACDQLNLPLPSSSGDEPSRQDNVES